MIDGLRVNTIVELFRHVPILVIGDIMLDEYIDGDIRPAKPESWSPVINIHGHTQSLGGAANVAANIASLGGCPCLVGVTGSDQPGNILKNLIGQILPDALIEEDKFRPTTIKMHISAHGQRVARLDTESRNPISGVIETKIIDNITWALKGAKAVVISDYAKGVITERVCRWAIESSEHLNIPIIIDPKGNNYSKYRGATVITPNKYEHAELPELIIDHGISISSSLLVTKGSEGMSLYRSGASTVVNIPAATRAAFDPTGAGDTVVATLALALAVGIGLEEASRLANRAAGIVVGKAGTSTVSADELVVYSS